MFNVITLFPITTFFPIKAVSDILLDAGASENNELSDILMDSLIILEKSSKGFSWMIREIEDAVINLPISFVVIIQFIFVSSIKGKYLGSDIYIKEFFWLLERLDTESNSSSSLPIIVQL